MNHRKNTMNHHRNTINTNLDNRQFSPIDQLSAIIREVDGSPAQPVGEGSADDGLPELRGCFERILCVARSSDGPTVGNIQLADRLIKAVITRWRRPAVSPVAVSERLPGERDCAPWDDDPNATPWCWAGRKGDDGWEWAQISMLGLSIETLDLVISGGSWTHWAPHWAFPVPQATLSTTTKTP
jgi:hypothetical protein